MIRRIRRWLVLHFLPALASRALEQEVTALRNAYDRSLAELERVHQDKARLESYCNGLERALRSRQVHITVRGGADIYGQE